MAREVYDMVKSMHTPARDANKPGFTLTLHWWLTKDSKDRKARNNDHTMKIQEVKDKQNNNNNKTQMNKHQPKI